MKLTKHDFEMLQVNFSNHRIEFDQKMKTMDKDIDEFIESM